MKKVSFSLSSVVLWGMLINNAFANTYYDLSVTDQQFDYDGYVNEPSEFLSTCNNYFDKQVGLLRCEGFFQGDYVAGSLRIEQIKYLDYTEYHYIGARKQPPIISHCRARISYRCRGVPEKFVESAVRQWKSPSPYTYYFLNYFKKSWPSEVRVAELKHGERNSEPGPTTLRHLWSLGRIQEESDVFSYLEILTDFGFFSENTQAFDDEILSFKNANNLLSDTETFKAALRLAAKNPEFGSVPNDLCNWDRLSNLYHDEFDQNILNKTVRRFHINSVSEEGDDIKYIEKVVLPHCRNTLRRYGQVRSLLKKYLDVNPEIIDLLSLPIIAMSFANDMTFHYLGLDDLQEIHKKMSNGLQSWSEKRLRASEKGISWNSESILLTQSYVSDHFAVRNAMKNLGVRKY